jgi:hypothetical protein
MDTMPCFDFSGSNLAGHITGDKSSCETTADNTIITTPQYKKETLQT